MIAAPEPVTDISLADYLAALYPAGTPGALLAYVKEPFCRRFGYASGLPRFAREIIALDREQCDVYLTINTLDARAIEARGTFKRGEEAEVTAVVGLVADVDASGKEGHNYPPQDYIVQALAAMPLQASLVVLSGRADGGLHVYWLFDEPRVIDGNLDRDTIKDISRRWQGLLKAKLHPFELDSTFDLVRVLRPVGTHNTKYGSVVRALAFHPERRYKLEDFAAVLPEPVRQTSAKATSTVSMSSAAERAARYVAKVPGAVSGQRGHDHAFHVACLLVLGFGLSVDAAYPILADWNQTCQPPWTEAELWHKLAGADAQTERRGSLLEDQNSDDPSKPKITRLVLGARI